MKWRARFSPYEACASLAGVLPMVPNLLMEARIKQELQTYYYL